MVIASPLTNRTGVPAGPMGLVVAGAVVTGAAALARGDYAELGMLMNVCHGLLNAIEVSTPELEAMVSIARAAGAAGAKVTGSGGGGSIVALSPGAVDNVRDALEEAGFRTLGYSKT